MGNMNSYGGNHGGMAPGSGAGMRGGLPEEKNVAQVVSEHTNVYARKFQILLDKSTPHTMERWLFTFGVFLLFGLNVVLRQGVCLSSRPRTSSAHDGRRALVGPALVQAHLVDAAVVYCLLRPRHLHPQPLPRVPPTAVRPERAGRPGRGRSRGGRAGPARLRAQEPWRHQGLVERLQAGWGRRVQAVHPETAW